MKDTLETVVTYLLVISGTIAIIRFLARKLTDYQWRKYK